MRPNFVIDMNPVVEWPVSVQLPRGGEFVAFGFTAKIKVMSETDYAALLASTVQTADEQDAETRETQLIKVLESNARVLPQLVLSWDVKDAAGAEVPIESLPAMLTGPYGRPLSVALYHAIAEIRYGVRIEDKPSASEKNSEPSPASGVSATAAADATN